MKTRFTDILNKYFNLSVINITEQVGGWSARAFKIDTTNGVFFLKAYEKYRASTAQWTSTIDIYMPIVIWLYNNTGLRDKIICPVLTTDGKYKCEDDNLIYILFPYIEGYTLCDKKMTNTQIKEMADIIAELHKYGAEIPVATNTVKEDFAVPFCYELKELISLAEETSSNETMRVLKEYEAVLIKNIEKTILLAERLLKENLSCVICHTDVHGWNLMQSDRLILIDWEGMKLAPPEADLFAFIGDRFWHTCSSNFLETYKKVHPYYIINSDSLEFYQTRRRIEDICAFAKGLLCVNANEEEIKQSLYYLRRECSSL
ncbi:MAG: aminoglycoside phosphotransferase family protein [Clostridia bacterium]|nr:aminoglycoside phosphotransferase family protein [Clostridia bacterium]